MNRLLNFMNWLTDMDWGWWPLLKYRPAKDAYIDCRVLIKITPFFGTLTGLIFVSLLNAYDKPGVILLNIVLGWLIFFIFHRLTFSIAWNYRADDIRKGN